MSAGEALTFMVFCLSTCLTLFGIWYLRNRENMALIEKGFNPRQSNIALPRPYGNLKYGLLLAGAGLGLAIAFLLDNALVHKKLVDFHGGTHEQAFTALYFSLIAIGGGLGLVVSYVVERKAWERMQQRADKERLS